MDQLVTCCKLVYRRTSNNSNWAVGSWYTPLDCNHENILAVAMANRKMRSPESAGYSHFMSFLTW